MKKQIKLLIVIIATIFATTIDVDAKNIVTAYTYDEANDATKCMTGEEETCVETKCYQEFKEGSCPAGTIIKYKVNDTEEKYFYVLYDNNNTMTLQQRENTIDTVAWYETAADNTKGPITVLSELENITSGWTNVNNQTYIPGTTVFKENAFTGCAENGCSTNTYTLGERNANARLITYQELTNIGCTPLQATCPTWMHDFLNGSHVYGGTTNGTRLTYVSMSATSNYPDAMWIISSDGVLRYTGTTASSITGARAVVVVNKEEKEVITATTNNQNKKTTQVVKVGDTAKTARIETYIGIVVLILGIMVLIQTFKKKQEQV